MTTKSQLDETSTMSVEIDTVEFQRPQPQDTLLSEDDEGPPFEVHGVALGEDDVTVGQSGIKKLWPEEELRKAAKTLEGRSLVEDHNNGSRGVVGQVTSAGYKDGVGVIYEAELYDEELADKVDNGLLEVSIRGHHIDVDEMEEDPETGAKIVEGIKFDNLSIVPSGAAPSNSIEMGEHDELSTAQLAEAVAELQETDGFEAGDTVEWNDSRGIILQVREDDADEVEVDVYDEIEGKWRSTGETETVAVGDLSEWDVSMEDIGPMEGSDEEEASSNEESDEEAAKHHHEASRELIDEFLSSEEGDSSTSVQDFLDWAESEDAQRAADEFVEAHEDASMDSDVSDFDDWLETVLNRQHGDSEDEDEEEARVEGEEDPVETTPDKEEVREQSPERFSPDETDEASEEARKPPQRPRRVDDDGDEPNVQDTGPVGISLELINKYLQDAGRHERDTVNDMLGWLMGSTDLPIDTLGDFRVAANTFLDQTPGSDSFDALRIEQFRDWLLVNSRGEPQRDLSGDMMSDEELQETEVHRPEFTGTTESDWSKPALEDFGEDPDLSEVANHFLVSVTGFPPENYGDLALPVVEPNGNLNLSALQNAKARANQVQGLSGEDLDRAVSIINSLANEEFDADFEENEDGSPDGQNELGAVSVLTGDDLRDGGKSEESEMGSITTIDTRTMTDSIEDKLAELEEPVAVEKSDFEDLQDKADRFDEMADTLEDLRERTDVLDEVDREQVDELAESEDPVVIESARYEALNDEAEQVKGVYASALSDAVDVFDADELTDRFSIEELREKYEEHIGEPEEELASGPEEDEAEPRSGDVEEEELEEQAEEEAEEEEELSEEDEKVEEMQAELREKILGER